MKKTFIMVLASLALSLSVHAVRPVHVAFPVKQADGTTVLLYKNGDGHLAFYTTLDNQVVVRNGEGMLCYAKLENGQLVATSIVTHDIADRSEAEKQFVSSNTLKPTDAPLVKLAAPKRSSQRAGNASTSDGLGKYNTRSGGAVPSLGSLTIPVIMVNFSDVKFQSDMNQDKLSRFFNQEGYNEDNTFERGSVRDYFLAQSRGLFNPTFDVVANVTLDHDYAYYGANSYGSDGRAMTMVKEAVAKAVAQGVDFSQYKTTEGNVPNVTIYYAGCGEATGGDENTIWPHERDLSPYYGTFSGTYFKSYYVGNELYGTSTQHQLMGMGVFVHEFSHALGLPDFYVTDYSYSDDSPFGGWSVMDEGEYDNNTYAPVGYNAYERSFMGWLNIRELSDAESVTLTNPNDEEGEMAVMVRNPNNAKEYFILENRQPGTWYGAGKGTGLMISRFAYDSYYWTGNMVNNTQSAKRAMIVTASGRTIKSSSNSQEADLFGNGENKKLGYTFLNNSYYNGLPIYKIIKQPNGTVTFNFKDATLPTAAVSNGVEYDKVTDVNTLSANDTIIFVNEASSVALGVDQQSSYRSAASVQLSSDHAYGNASVLEFALMRTTNGQGWGFYAPGKKAYLSSSSTGLKLSTKADANCIASIAINDGNASVAFTGNYSYKNLGYSTDDTYFTCFTTAMNNLQIYRKKVATGIRNIEQTSTTASSRIYTLKGQYVGTSLAGLPKGVYIQQGRKIVVK